MKDLKRCFNNAVKFNSKYVAIMVSIEGFSKPEIIINPIENVYEKLEYYQKAYNDDLTHKYSDGIRIV